MALPFILGAAALAAAGYGAKKGYDGYQDKSLADEIVKDAQTKYEGAKQAYDTQNQYTNQDLESLGTLQLKIGSDFGEFRKLADKLLDKINQSRSGKDLAINVPQHRLEAIKRLELSATTYLGQVVGAGVGGAAAAYAVYGGVMAFAAASTGTSIATLSGAAATNAALAAIGGGSLAAGGLGMAGGTVILGGVVAAPVLAIAGWAYASYAEEALDKARESREQVDSAVKKMAACVTTLRRTSRYVQKVQSVTQRIYKEFLQYFDELKSMNTFVEAGGNIQEKSDETLHIIANGYQMAAILTDIITTPLFKPKTNAQNKAVLDADGKAELLIGDNGLPVLNAQALDNAVDEGRQKLNRSIG